MLDTVKFLGEECTVFLRKYHDGNTCIQLLCKDSSPMCTATINMPEINTDPEYVVIKDYSENRGVLEVLEKALIVKRLEDFEINQFGTRVWLCKLLNGMYSFN